MTDSRIHGPAAPAINASAPPTRADAGRIAAPRLAGDRLALSPRQAAAPDFSWGRAWHHLERGFVGELKQMVLAPLHHPLATLATVAATTGLLLAAPLIGVSAVAVGNVMLLGFGGLALWRMAQGGQKALADYRRHDFARAEADFETIGAGGADLAATVGPSVLGKGLTIVRRSEAGRALGQVAAQSKIGRAVARAKSTSVNFVRTSLWGPLKAAPGESEKLAALGERARGVTAGLPGKQRLQATLSRLNAWRLRIAHSGPVRGFNNAFDTVPQAWSDAIEGHALSSINYSKPARSVRDWALIRAAHQRGQSLAELKAVVEQRRIIPRVTERSQSVSATLQRGPVPTTAADFEYLVKEKQIKTIVTLLHPSNPDEIALLESERKLAAQFGVKLIELPLPFGIDPPAEMVERFLAAVDQATPESRVYVHCRLGRDRTGTLVAVYREARQGVSGVDALKEMRTFGFDPEKDTYLAYLAKYVVGYMQRGVVDARKLFLRGDAQAAARAVRTTVAAEMPVASKPGEDRPARRP